MTKDLLSEEDSADLARAAASNRKMDEWLRIRLEKESDPDRIIAIMQVMTLRRIAYHFDYGFRA